MVLPCLGKRIGLKVPDKYIGLDYGLFEHDRIVFSLATALNDSAMLAPVMRTLFSGRPATLWTPVFANPQQSNPQTEAIEKTMPANQKCRVLNPVYLAGFNLF